MFTARACVGVTSSVGLSALPLILGRALSRGKTSSRLANSKKDFLCIQRSRCIQCICSHLQADGLVAYRSEAHREA